MSSDVLTRVHYLLFSPEYHLIMPKVYISTFAKSTTIQAARIQMVDDLDDYPELQHIMPPLCSLSLLQLPGNEAMMELLQTASKKRPTKVVAFLAQKSLDGSFLPEVLSGELYFATILCPSKGFSYN
ncbi:hypothetical protein GYMLUDRAFT_371405 [Collybiopsis luxurians FD-317 M1]|uniref:Unplaced genomic scaffold GYMLUscaffold_100, whole genome shotgun sequence n=1 Tax=Collybiopsis luxurians FD-317 M1 TaxID=944289 RepID=A0A0D0APE8_9AGAR|nr:hypothetical protein GYMLUDRAFT_371405 [Collybiopsis luxurians FD-317 M1]